MSLGSLLFKNIDDIFRIAEAAPPSIKTTFTTRQGKKLKTQERQSNIPKIIFELEGDRKKNPLYSQRVEAANKIIEAYNRAGKSTKMSFVLDAVGYKEIKNVPLNLKRDLTKKLNNRAENALIQFEKALGDTSKTPIENVFNLKENVIAPALGLARGHGVDPKLYQNSPLWKKFDTKIGNFFGPPGLAQKNFQNSIRAEQDAIGKQLTIDEAFEYFLGRTKNGTKNLNRASGLAYGGPISALLR